MDDPDDLRGEAEAQSEETLMPWIWGVVGLAVVGAFVAWAVYGAPHTAAREPAGVPPALQPATRSN